MGLGKTIQTLAALRVLLHRRRIQRALIVAPASLLEQWRRAAALWTPELRVMVVGGAPTLRRWQWNYRAHLTVVSYETLRADWEAILNEEVDWSELPTRGGWDVVALDEAQRIKNRDSAVAQICKALPRRRSWALTGTPLENHIDDAASILEFVTAKNAIFPDVPRLRVLLAQHQLRRRKAEVLPDLPPKIVTTLPLPLTTEQRAAYDDLTSSAAEQWHAALEAGRAALRGRFSASDAASATLQFRAGRSGVFVEVGRFARTLARYHRKRRTRFNFYAVHQRKLRRETIARELSQWKPLLFTGDMDVAARQRALDKFAAEDGPSLLIVSLRAGGVGLNLQSASYVFHFDRWWNPATETQAEDRAHRPGQTRPVHVYRYVMLETIEERVDEILRAKRELFAQVMEESDEEIRGLSREDFLQLAGVKRQ